LGDGGTLQVPARRAEALARARDDRDTQRRVGAKRREDLVQPPARRQVDGVRLRAVDGYFENGAVGYGSDAVGHSGAPYTRRTKASTTMAPSPSRRTMTGFRSSSASCSIFAAA